MNEKELESLNKNNSFFLKNFEKIINTKDFKLLAKFLSIFDENTLNKAVIYEQCLKDYGLDEREERKIIEDVYKSYLDKYSHLFSEQINNEIEDRACEACEAQESHSNLENSNKQRKAIKRLN